MSRRLAEERLRHQTDLDRIDEALGDAITELEFAKRRMALQKALQQEP